MVPRFKTSVFIASRNNSKEYCSFYCSISQIATLPLAPYGFTLLSMHNLKSIRSEMMFQVKLWRLRKNGPKNKYHWTFFIVPLKRSSVKFLFRWRFEITSGGFLRIWIMFHQNPDVMIELSKLKRANGFCQQGRKSRISTLHDIKTSRIDKNYL